MREAAQGLVHAVAQYAAEMGEEWRVGEGTEIMDALEVLEDELWFYHGTEEVERPKRNKG